jgi:hypothetical protein
MGKGMMNGKVLYRDIFDQKGPLLYFIHGLAYLISNRTFMGVYIMETASFSLFLFICYKISSLFLESRYSVIPLALLAAVILNMRSFAYGDSAEEFCLPLIGYSLYSLLRYFKNRYPGKIGNKMLLLNGAAAGLILWIKFSLLGFCLGWMASLLVCMILDKNYLSAVKSGILFLAGMVLTTLPWIIYFGINHSIRQWIGTYFLMNVNCYPVSMNLGQRAAFILKELGHNMAANPIFSILSCSGLWLFVFSKRYLSSRSGRASLFFSVALLAILVYGGGRGYRYYFLIFAPLAIFGLIAFLDFIGRCFRQPITGKIAAFAVMVSLAAAFPATLLDNGNISMLSVQKNSLFQYQFASIIDQTKNPTLLNYGYLDMGLYTLAGITPNVKFFQKLNIPYSRFPSNMNSQNQYIKEGKVDFVLVRDKITQGSPKIPFLYNNYKLIKVAEQKYKGTDYDYLLFEKIKLPKLQTG